MEGGRVLRVACNVKRATIYSNEGITAQELLWREAEVKLFEDVVKGFGKKFCTLLDESGSCRDFIRQEIKIFEQFIVDTAGFHGEEEMDQLYKPEFAVT